jgi:hypothetical protein
MRLFITIIIAVGVCGLARAADPNITINNNAKASSDYGPRSPIVVEPLSKSKFDDKVFDLEPKTDGPETVRGKDGTERYSAPAAKFNTEQSREWKIRCAPEKKISFKAYRKCFERMQKESLDNIQQGNREVEDRIERPLRNTGRVPEKRIPNPDIEIDRMDEED